MSNDFLQIELSDEAKALLNDLPNATARASRNIAKALDLLNEGTISEAQRNKMSGPGPTTLGVRTGLLRRSLRRTNATISDTFIDGAIGENVAYAAAHEFGFDGDVEVHPFVRRQRSRDALGKRKKVIATGIAFVKGFTRHMHLPERSFIRSTIADRLDIYKEDLSEAIVAGLGGTE